MQDLQVRLDRAAGGLANQLAAELRTAVRSGRLAAGGRLPATRELARDLETSRGVVVEAYQQLVAEGFLTSRQGSGTRVAPVAPPGAIAEAAAGAQLRYGAAAGATTGAAAPGLAGSAGATVGAAAPGLAGSAGATVGVAMADLAGSAPAPPGPAYDLRVGTPDLAAFPRRAWLAALRRVLTELPHQALGYGDPGGVPELRSELAAYLRRVRAADVAAERLVVVNGVAQGLHLTVGALARAGPVRLAVEDPHSARTYDLLEDAGAVPVPVAVDHEGIDVGALRRTSARAVLVTPAHQYPTGVVLSPPRRAELITWAEEVDGFVLEDDYDAEFRYDRNPVGCLQGLCPHRVVLLGSVSKSLAPVLRLGWLAAPPALASAVRQARAVSDLGSPVIDQHALAQLVVSGAYDRHLRQMRRRYRARRDALTAALSRWLPAAVPHGVAAGIQLYLELPAGVDETAVVAAAAVRGLAVEGVAPLRIDATGPPALVLGFARLPEHRAPGAARVLAAAVAAARAERG